MKKIDCYLFFGESDETKYTVQNLQTFELVHRIIPIQSSIMPSMFASETFRWIAASVEAEYIFLYTKGTVLKMGMFAIDRMVQILEDSGAGFVYADHYQLKEGMQVPAPVIDYQLGSLRDDFDFGSVLLCKTTVFKEVVSKMIENYHFAGLYDFRLKLSQKYSIVHINEFLYTEVELDNRKSGVKIFDYVDPKNRERQIEMEQACTAHLKEIGGYLAPKFEKFEFDQGSFKYEASVIIPVRNRIRTIRDAIRSVLCQQTDFSFNLIIIDNHSTDGTTEAIDEFKEDPRVIHLIPERHDLGIGGCWNLGISHKECGKFSVQLDSDDVYKDTHTLSSIIRCFYEQNCAMVVGTYMMTDFNMHMIEPGIIDHREWTPENGRNNALRINGLGAPRAFYTPILRTNKVPNTSYGEDYALGLKISRRFKIGRIYDVIYLCRRWDDNSDASLDIAKINNHNLYKDRIRTWELQARIAMNRNMK